MISITDGHCDTLVKAFEEGVGLRKNNLHIDFERLSKYNGAVQFFAMWLDKRYYAAAYDKTMKIIDFYYDELKKNSDLIAKAESYGDIVKNKKDDKISAVLAIEGGEAIEGSLKKLEDFYNRGVRAMTLTWNYKNDIADGAGAEPGGGLTSFGFEVIEKMNDLGMLVDVSHLADKGFYDVAAVSKKPFIATHSNARAVCGKKRNLTDDQIKILAEQGGVTGLNLYSGFLRSDGQAGIDDILKTADRIIDKGGEDVLGLGCDFDGIDTMPVGFTGIESLTDLINIFSMRYGDRVAEKIAEGNFLRVLKYTL